jgi:Meiotically up-regulated gene 113
MRTLGGATHAGEDSSAVGIPRNIRGFVYVVQMEGHPWFKIGRVGRGVGVSEAVRRRVAGMQVGCPMPLHVVKEYPCESPETIEWLVHKVLAGDRRRGEWLETTLKRLTGPCRLRRMTQRFG